MKQEEFESIIAYLDHGIADSRLIFKQLYEGRAFEAEMMQKSISITNEFIKDDMEFSGKQIRDLLKHIYEVPFMK